MASLAEQMVEAGRKKAKERSKGDKDVPCDGGSPCYVNVEKAVNGYTVRFGGGDMGWQAGTAVAKDAKEIGDAIVKFLESQGKE